MILGCCCPEHPLCPLSLGRWIWRWGFEGCCPALDNGNAFIPQGKMSQNFRASYTETLGKLETQYCKLMVSGLCLHLKQCLMLQGAPAVSWAHGSRIPVLL